MKEQGKSCKRNDYAISFLFSLLIGAFFWLYSDLPPYGTPDTEFNFNYWCYVIGTAHAWRDFQFSFWHQGLAGGSALFTSGVWPIFHPTNWAAWFLNDDQFIKLKLVEPYAFGFFFISLLFRRFFKLSWPAVIFGALLYLSLPFCRQSNMVQSPLFLWGIYLFPLMIWAFLSFEQKDIKLSCYLAGALIALQFATCGVLQLPQLLIWWTVFIFVTRFAFRLGSNGFVSAAGGFTVGFLLFLAGFFLCAVQFIPSFEFFTKESARAAGKYGINSFPLFGHPENGNSLPVVFESFWRPVQSIGFTVWLALVWFAAAVLIARPLRQSRHLVFLRTIWFATILYFIVPTIAGTVASIHPFFTSLLKILSTFTFAYGLHTFDFCVVLTMVLVLSSSESRPLFAGPKIVDFIASAVTWLAVLTAAFIYWPFIRLGLWNVIPMYSYYFVERFFIPISIFSAGTLIFLNMAPERYRAARACWWAILIFVTAFSVVICFNWHDKGRRMEYESFNMDSPEYKYFREAKDQYFLSYDDCPSMMAAYPLLFDIHGTSALLPVAPYRLNKFTALYHNDRYGATKNWASAPNYHIIRPSESLMKRLPADFTAVEKDKPLPWAGFIKEVSGTRCDIWVRNIPKQDIRFVNHIEVLPFEALVVKMDSPLEDGVFLEEEDSRNYDFPRLPLPREGLQAQARNYKFEGDRITFEVTAPSDVLAVVPVMFQKGWRAAINSKSADIFPADYILIGLKIPQGKHVVSLRFEPPAFKVGLLVSFISIAVLCILIIQFRRGMRKL